MKDRIMITESSDIINLLNVLSYEQGDWTCRNLHARAVRKGLPLLKICHQAARMLSREKKGAIDRLPRIASTMPPRPESGSAEELAKSSFD